MFIISTLYAILACVFVVALCSYIFIRREKREWGNAVVGLRLSQATSNLIALSDMSYRKRSVLSNVFGKSGRKNRNNFVDTEEVHLKGVNWRPQVMVFCKLTEDLTALANEDLLRLASQLKKGRGLTIAHSVSINESTFSPQKHASGE